MIELALAAADRDHRVDGLQAGLHGLADRLALDDAGGSALDRIVIRGGDRALPVDRPAERVHDASHERRSHRHLDDLSGAADLLALADLPRLAEKHDADVVFLEVQGETEEVVTEVEELSGHRLVEAVHARDAVADRQNRADFRDVDRLFVAGQLPLQDFRDFVRLDFHLAS